MFAWDYEPILYAIWLWMPVKYLTKPVLQIRVYRLAFLFENKSPLEILIESIESVKWYRHYELRKDILNS